MHETFPSTFFLDYFKYLNQYQTNNESRVQVTKLDVETGEVKMFMEDQIYIAADPIFVPRPGATVGLRIIFV